MLRCFFLRYVSFCLDLIVVDLTYIVLQLLHVLHTDRTATMQSVETKSTVTSEDIRSHNHAGDCWIAIDRKVWDVTDFLSIHPGGSEGMLVHSTIISLVTNAIEVILRYAGSDATSAYNEIHGPGMLEETLTSDKYIGDLPIPNNEPSKASAFKTTFTRSVSQQPVTQEAAVIQIPPQVPVLHEKPPLHTLISAPDFQYVAQQTFTPKAWAFYSSAATDLVTHTQNKAFIRRIMFRPRILRDVKDVSMRRKILGCSSSVPFFISPAAMARLAHPDGECALARASASEEIVQCISSNASYTLSAIVNSGRKAQDFFLQLYVNSDRHKTEELLRRAADLGIRGIFVTVDAPVPGKREADERIAAEAVTSAISGAVASNDKKGGGMGRLMAQYVDKRLVWSDIKWISEVSGLPVVLKGVQSAADVMMACTYGAKGAMLSNHGGRSLDGYVASMRRVEFEF